MAQKNSHKSKNKEVSSWYSLIIATASMILSAIMSIISIVNSNSIARLDKEVYVPRLQYKIGQEESGRVFMEVTNQGNVSAANVVVGIDWNPPYMSLSKCFVQPPNQDVTPVQPVLSNNLTYRLTVLHVNEVFKVTCNFDAQGSNEHQDFLSLLPNDTADSTPSENHVAGTSPPSEYQVLGTPVNISAAFVFTEPNSLTMSVVAENATFTTQIGNLPGLLQTSPTATAVP